MEIKFVDEFVPNHSFDPVPNSIKNLKKIETKDGRNYKLLGGSTENYSSIQRICISMRAFFTTVLSFGLALKYSENNRSDWESFWTGKKVIIIYAISKETDFEEAVLSEESATCIESSEEDSSTSYASEGITSSKSVSPNEIAKIPEESLDRKIKHEIIDENKTVEFNPFGLHQALEFFITNPGFIACNFSHFQLTQEKTIQLIDLLLEKDPNALKRHLALFPLKILPSDQLNKIVDLLLERDCWVLAKNLDLFPFEKLPSGKIDQIGDQISEKNGRCFLSNIAKFRSQGLTIDKKNEIIDRLIESDVFQIEENYDILDLNSEQQFKLIKRLMELERYDIFKKWVAINELTSSQFSELLEIAKFTILKHPQRVEERKFSFFLERNNKEEIFLDYPAIAYFLKPEEILERSDIILKTPYFNELAREVKKELEKGTQEAKWKVSKLFKWLGYIEIKAMSCGIFDIELDEAKKILNKLANLGLPKLRYEISQFLFDQLTQKNFQTDLKSAPEFSGNGVLFQLVLMPLFTDPLVSGKLGFVIKCLKSKFYKDKSMFKIALKSLWTLMKNSTFTVEEKIKILQVAFLEENQENKNTLENKGAGFKLIQNNLQIIDFLIFNISRGTFVSKRMKEKFLIACKNSNSLQLALQEMFEEEIDCTQTKDFNSNFLNTFGSFRKPNAIFIYLGKLKELPEDEKINAIKAFKVYVESMLNRNLSTIRYEEAGPGDHLSTVFQGNDSLKKQWMQGDSKELTEMISSEQDSGNVDLSLNTQKKKITSFEGWSVVDTDNPEDLFMCGEEFNTCQSVDLNPEYNKCLLGYLLDGKIRLVAIKDAEGRMKARTIIRILWDDVNKQPVLFKEQVYQKAGIDPQALTALDNMCVARAKNLGLSLVATGTQDKTPSFGPYPNPLKSLSCKAPFEYVDALSELSGVTNGEYTLDSTQILWKKDESLRTDQNGLI